jgi:hypothetical protein
MCRIKTARSHGSFPAACAGIAAVVLLLSVSFEIAAAARSVTLSDREFWKMVVDFSEPGQPFRSSGAVRTDNLISNEAGFQRIIPALQRTVGRGVYLGVGPEQNFTYIAALKPEMAFIIDIRRENLSLHLMYKALFEMSGDRADFLSSLFARQRPADLGDESTAAALFDAFRRTPSSGVLAATNVQAIIDRLKRLHGFGLSPADERDIKNACDSFRLAGPDIRWDTSGDAWIPSYADLMTATDSLGRPHGYLASEENFRIVKEYEVGNRIVPLVGDFAGDRTIRAVGRYLRARDTIVGAFYTSNVESYLFPVRWRTFFRNVSTLPIDQRSMFVRTRFAVAGYDGTRPQYETWTGLDSIRDLLRAVKHGEIRFASDLERRSKT